VKTAFGSLVLLSVVCGCGSSVPVPAEAPTDPEALAIREVIYSVNSAEDFRDIFAGTPPKQKEFQSKYLINFPQIDPMVKVTGDTAEVNVEVSQEVEGYDETKTQLWTMKKVEGKWKIDSAPVN
jgi:hypothetical protein